MATNIPLSQIMGKMQSKRAGSAASQHYGRQRLAHGGLSGYGPATEAAWQTTPDTYVPGSLTGTVGTGGTTGTATPTTPTATGLSPQDIAAQKLALALRGQGVNWDYTVGQPYAPQASLIGGTAWNRIKNMPSLYEILMQAVQASGQGATPALSRANYLAEIGLFQHAAPAYSTVNYGW